MMRFRFATCTLLAAVVPLAACEVGPDYKPASVEAPAAYKEIAGTFKPAKPDDAIDRGAWWSVFKDPVLDKLEKQVEVSNQNLKVAEAEWQQERAIVDEARAGLLPSVAVGGSGISQGGGNKSASLGRTVTSYNMSASASWTLDIWGQIRRTIESDIATAQASAADVALARLSAQGDLATDYFTLRAQDELKKLLDQTVVDDRKALKIVQNQYDAGIAAKADVLTAQTELESVEAQAVNVNVERSQLEHAIAVLIGKPPAALTIARAPLPLTLPKIPAGLPSELLERRPDIAAAERQMASANAEIGVAIAAWYPNISLSGSYGYSVVQMAQLLAAPYSVWTLGPSLTETVFDGGLREAQVEAAHAGYDQTVANYRQTVLTGFQQVEDQLSTLHWLADQAKIETKVVADARKSEELELNQYQQGIVPYSSVLTAQVTTLTNEETALTVRQNRYVAAVALIQALGGGWNMSEIGKDTDPLSKPTKPAVPEQKLPTTEPDKLMVENPAPPAETPSAPVAPPVPDTHIAGVTLYSEPQPTVSIVSNINRGL